MSVAERGRGFQVTGADPTAASTRSRSQTTFPNTANGTSGGASGLTPVMLLGTTKRFRPPFHSRLQEQRTSAIASSLTSTASRYEPREVTRFPPPE
jgi:hypothetical protein